MHGNKQKLPAGVQSLPVLKMACYSTEERDIIYHNYVTSKSFKQKLERNSI